MAGTVPVTDDGQAVARVDDKSGNGCTMFSQDAPERPVYRTNGTLHWLAFDGSNDRLKAFFGELDGTYVLPQTHEIHVSVGDIALADGDSGSLWQYRHYYTDTSVAAEMAVYRSGSAYRLRTTYPSIDTFSDGHDLAALTSQAGVVAQARFALGDHKQYFNGVQTKAITTTSSAFSTAHRLNALGEHVQSSQFIGYKWYGTVIADPLIADARAGLTTYLGAKAGLAL
jgi:hypothetical protein